MRWIVRIPWPRLIYRAAVSHTVHFKGKLRQQRWSVCLLTDSLPDHQSHLIEHGNTQPDFFSFRKSTINNQKENTNKKREKNRIMAVFSLFRFGNFLFISEKHNKNCSGAIIRYEGRERVMEAVSSGWVRCDLLLMSETNERSTWTRKR